MVNSFLLGGSFPNPFLHNSAPQVVKESCTQESRFHANNALTLQLVCPWSFQLPNHYLKFPKETCLSVYSYEESEENCDSEGSEKSFGPFSFKSSKIMCLSEQ